MAGDGHPFYHAAAQFGGIEFFGPFEVHTVQAEGHPLPFFRHALAGEHVKRKADVLFHSGRVEQGAPLEYHAHIAPDGLLLAEIERCEERVAVVYLAFVHRKEAGDAFDEHRLAGTAAADYHVDFARQKGRRYVFQYRLAVEGLVYVFAAYHR